MTTLLHIQASPSKERSNSTEVATTFVTAYRDAHPDHTIDVLDLWTEELPPFDADAIGAKFAVLRRTDATPAQHTRWDQLRALSARFNGADRIVLSVPMWNFGIPYRLKHYIDAITLAGENWTWSPDAGFRGLLAGKRAVLVYASAGGYTLASGATDGDFQKGYLRHWLAFLGIDDVHEINVAPTLADAITLAATKETAHRAAVELARRF